MSKGKAAVGMSGNSKTPGSRVGDDLVDAFEEIAAYLRGEIEVDSYDISSGATCPATETK